MSELRSRKDSILTTVRMQLHFCVIEYFFVFLCKSLSFGVLQIVEDNLFQPRVIGCRLFPWYLYVIISTAVASRSLDLVSPGRWLLVLQLRCCHLQRLLSYVCNQAGSRWSDHIELPLSILCPLLCGIVRLYRVSFRVPVKIQVLLMVWSHDRVVPLMELTIFAITKLSLYHCGLEVTRHCEIIAFIVVPYAFLLLVSEWDRSCLLKLDIVGLIQIDAMLDPHGVHSFRLVVALCCLDIEPCNWLAVSRIAGVPSLGALLVQISIRSTPWSWGVGPVSSASSSSCRGLVL